MATKNTKWPSYNEIVITKFYNVFIFYGIVGKESGEIVIVVLK